MLHRPIDHAIGAVIVRAGRLEAARNDAETRFPAEALNALAALGLAGRPPIRAGQAGLLLRTLAAVGRGDLNVGRIYEGHVNALWLIARYADPAQVEDCFARARAGDLFGVWNTDAPGDPLRLEQGGLKGKKNFATGADGLSHALVTVDGAEGRVMILAPLADLTVDRSWWRPLGMRASGSHVVDFTGLAIPPDGIIGAPDDYIREPWFSAGAMRFVAVHTGGLHAVADAARDHLVRTGRADDPYQAHRLGRIAIAVQASYGWLETAARAWERADAKPEQAIATTNAARAAVEANALIVLEEAERGVGAAGLIAPHPLERLIRDLRTYLRQPNPDGALASVGAAYAGGVWRPGAGDADPAHDD